MSRIAILSLCLLVLTGCDKDETDNLTTSFQGIAINNTANGEAFTGQIEVIGNFFGTAPGEVFRKTFQIESNGSFDITVTTTDVRYFQLSLIGYEQNCLGPTTEGSCTFLDAGKDHTDLEIYAVRELDF